MVYNRKEVKDEFFFGKDASDQEGLSRGPQYTVEIREHSASISYLSQNRPGQIVSRGWEGSGGTYRVTSEGGDKSAPFLPGTSRFILNKKVPDTTACHIPNDNASTIAESRGSTAIPTQKPDDITAATVDDSSQKTIVSPKSASD
jgi:hypothetical protein